MEPEGPGPTRCVVPAEAAGERLDVFVARAFDAPSRSAAARWLADGRVLLDGETAPASRRLRGGETLEVEPASEDDPTAPPEAEDLPMSILHEDQDLVVVDKAVGMVVHPGAGVRSGTLVNALVHRYGEAVRAAGEPSRPGIVHRLDRGTSGVMVVARTAAAHAALAAAFAERRVEKRYRAVTFGVPREPRGVVEAPIGRSPSVRTRMCVGGVAARAARTRWETEESYGRHAALLGVLLETGRTHQVRVHLASIGHPLIGDATYGGRRGRNVADPVVRSVVERFERPALPRRSPRPPAMRITLCARSPATTSSRSSGT